MTKLLKTPAAWPRPLLGRTGEGDPTDLDRAVKAGAFEGLKKAVGGLSPAGVVAEIRAAGLLGRGGAGYSTADKWQVAAATPADRRYVVANGYGADPAVRTDAVLLELDPYAVIEGLAIAAWAIGAEHGIIAVRATETQAIKGLEAALAAAEEAGFIGAELVDSGRPLDIEIRPVQGAYMLGEETVLLKALEGKRGQPEQRPPHPAERGLFGRPTVVQNVQTLALAAWILREGAAAFRAIGSPDAPGTILVHVRGGGGSGVAEVPLGTPLRAILALAGTITRSGPAPKAILVGGPSGGILPADVLDTPYAFDELRAAGAHVGSGSVVATAAEADVLELAELLTRFCAGEACGKTIPCRIATRRLEEIAHRINAGTPRPTDAILLADLSADIVASALCDHERLATLPMTSVMRYFQADLDAKLQPAAQQAAGQPEVA
ncbi:MAG TPA: NADH-ubiquinone oxidoreductase-F iron-sulfur binding region domain-containing protein, partial [Candidatus Limnocylindrales bacterium]